MEHDLGRDGWPVFSGGRGAVTEETGDVLSSRIIKILNVMLRSHFLMQPIGSH